MEAVKSNFNHVDPGRISVCFTWDDNCHAHYRLAAPQFKRRGLRCTFYINPGKEGFEQFLPGYRELAREGFEVGSHSFCHVNLTGLPGDELDVQIKASAEGIRKSIGVYPSTFAFPYHDYNGHTLSAVRAYHLETRNTLDNAVRFGIRTASSADEMSRAVNECVASRRNIVFSGHSAVSDEEGLGSEDCGYEPILLNNLNALLDAIQALSDGAEVLTFEQAALKEYLRGKGEVAGNSYTLRSEQLEYLAAFGIGAERLQQLI